MSSPIGTIGTMTAGIDGNPTMVCTGCSTVIAQGVAVSCVGDLLVPHKRHGSHKPHTPSIVVGSPTVYAMGKPVSFMGSACSCGDKLAVPVAPNIIVA